MIIVFAYLKAIAYIQFDEKRSFKMCTASGLLVLPVLEAITSASPGPAQEVEQLLPGLAVTYAGSVRLTRFCFVFCIYVYSGKHFFFCIYGI